MVLQGKFMVVGMVGAASMCLSVSFSSTGSLEMTFPSFVALPFVP